MHPTARAVPADSRRIILTDVTQGTRNDYYEVITHAPSGTLYVGTSEGRVYTSHDDGTTWDESTVMPEVRPLFQVPYQSTFFGWTRRAREVDAPDIRLSGFLPELYAESSTTGDTLASSSDYEPELAATFGSPQGSRFDIHDDLDALQGVSDGLSAGVNLIGLPGTSNRAPRLSLLLQARGRPTPKVNLDRLLLDLTGRTTDFSRIIIDPLDDQHLYATAKNGLYESFDGGLRWMRTFVGSNKEERATYAVGFSRTDPKRRYLGTRRGLFVSNDAGLSWLKDPSIPDNAVRQVLIDAQSPTMVYVVGYGGVFRSRDNGRSYQNIYYTTQAQSGDVQWIAQDPFNPQRAYIATPSGILWTDNLQEARTGDWQAIPRTRGLWVEQVLACTRHPGHFYALTRLNLHSINYAANGPEAYIIETWDGGDSWREMASNRTAGEPRLMTLDSRDPDVVWIAFSRAIVRASHTADLPNTTVAELTSLPVNPNEPSMSEVLEAAGRFNGLHPGEFQKSLDVLENASWIPWWFSLSFRYGRYHLSKRVDDILYADDRFRVNNNISSFQFMAWAGWSLPSIVNRPDTTAVIARQAVHIVVEEVRSRINHMVHRNYGELQRLRAKLRSKPASDLYTRAVEQTRLEYLETVVDLATGGLLTRRAKPVVKP